MQETEGQLQSIIQREKGSIQGSSQDREASGWFGKFNRLVTRSDPYELDIKNAQQKIATAEYAKTFLEEAGNAKSPEESVEALNKARRIAGMREVTADFSVSDKEPVSRGVNRVDTDMERYAVEQEAITASQETAETGLDIAGIVATAGLSTVVSAGKVAAKKSTEQGLKYAAKKFALERAKNVGDAITEEGGKAIASAYAENSSIDFKKIVKDAAHTASENEALSAAEEVAEKLSKAAKKIT